MRVGVNPFKRDLGRGTAYEPKAITVGILTFTPFLTGYYAEKLEVLKICLQSLQANTTVPFDLLVVDNGSCEEAVQYLQELHQSGDIQYLLLSSENLGVYGGTERIFHTAPGQIIAYSQDDIFFHPNWLERSLEVLDTFPDVGFVTGCPVRHSYNTAYSNVATKIPKKYADISTHTDHWQVEFDILYAESTGEPPGEYIRRNRNKVVPLYERDGIKAFPLGAHFQFLICKKVALQTLPFPYTGHAMGGTNNPQGLGFTDIFDAVLDGKGYAKYSTSEVCTEHMGNMLSVRVRELANRLKDSKKTLRKERIGLTTWQHLIVLIFRLPLLRLIPSWVTRWMERISYWKRLREINKDRV